METSSTTSQKDNELTTHQFQVLSQLSTPPVSAMMPPSGLLQAPGNEKLKEFFFNPIPDANRLKGKRIAVLAADGFEEIELTGPVWYFRGQGATVDIVGPSNAPVPERFGLTHPEMAKDHIMAIQYLTPVGWIKLDRRADEIKVDDYDAAFIPGGSWNPDNLRADKPVIDFLKAFSQAGKLVAAICHAPVVLATADLLRNKNLTGYWNIHVDLKNAGGNVTDVPVVVDGNLITSRHPIDIADFSTAVSDWLVNN